MAVATETPGRLFEPQRVESGAPEALEDAILRVWAELTAEGAADCPVCARPIRAVGPCDHCGSELS